MFSMMIGCPIDPRIRSATKRPITSVPTPAGNGTIIVTGRDGLL
jgi:hypothetical protein